LRYTEHLKKQYHHVFSEIRDIVQRENNFLVTTHINPDGDAISSVLLFSAILKHFKKDYSILLDDKVPRKFDFLAGVNEIDKFDPSFQNSSKVAVVLDASDLQRIGSVQNLLTPEMTVINIDHHPSNDQFGNLNLVAEKESSTVEIIYALIEAWDIPVTKDLATLIYSGIVCDTGRFLFPNTSHQSLAICAGMVKQGADPGWIAEKIYFRMSQQTISALTAALSTIEYHFNGSVCCMHLNNGFLKSKDVDTEGFVDHLLTVDGTEIQFMMVEKELSIFRVSFRSKGDFDVNQIAHELGGGGHLRAAGCVMNGSINEVITF